ncbi:hypothetical protein EOA16_07615 [Mesorhizobium sp. M7A.F.Ca.US.008.03.1.1]|nr:hypothetical protein EOA16_07615 [Mesorhizobium sp. M7A.F.Ca.US.008.03.1.1]
MYIGCEHRKPWRSVENVHRFVILGRSKERSDAAQTLGSMPLHQPKDATVSRLPTILRAPDQPSIPTDLKPSSSTLPAGAPLPRPGRGGDGSTA